MLLMLCPTHEIPDTLAELAQRLKFLSVADYDALRPRIDRIGRMLNGLISSLQPDPG
jgi:hypothetical protein